MLIKQCWTVEFYLGSYASWSWSYSTCSWIYNNICNQCLSLLTLWVRTPLMARSTVESGVNQLNNITPTLKFYSCASANIKYICFNCFTYVFYTILGTRTTLNKILRSNTALSTLLYYRTSRFLRIYLQSRKWNLAIVSVCDTIVLKCYNNNPTKIGMNFGTPEGKQFLLHKWHPVSHLKLYIWKWLSNTEMYLTLHADLGSSNIQMCWSLIAAPDTEGATCGARTAYLLEYQSSFQF
jgi:hypothetical protein